VVFALDRENTGLAQDTPRWPLDCRRAMAHKEFFAMTDTPARYTCSEYREEMLLLGLRYRLVDESLSAAEKEALLKEIAELENRMGMR
jgi:hypothetical protein